jgi:Glutaredoxin-like domain (DUF836)
MDPALGLPVPATPLVITLFGRPGCGLCREARHVLDALLGERVAAGLPAPPIVERDITTDPDLERAFLVEIPVVEVGAHRLLLATSPARIRHLLVEALDG